VRRAPRREAKDTRLNVITHLLVQIRHKSPACEKVKQPKRKRTRIGTNLAHAFDRDFEIRQ
jgi:hypothetical protein